MNGQDPAHKANYADPVFQAFTVKTTRGRARSKLDKAIADELGSGWQVQNYGGRSNYFDVFAEEGALTAGEAWDRTYRLRTHAGSPAPNRFSKRGLLIVRTGESRSMRTRRRSVRLARLDLRQWEGPRQGQATRMEPGDDQRRPGLGSSLH
jgi:hypothetical protein